MDPLDKHIYSPMTSFDGGDLDCGNGLLLLIRKHLDPLAAGQLLEIRSLDSSVEEDLPAWCRLTGNELVSWTKSGKQRSYLVCRGRFAAREVHEFTTKDIVSPSSSVETRESSKLQSTQQNSLSTPGRASSFSKLPTPNAINSEPPPVLSVMGVGSWPRPAWLIPYLHDFLEGKIEEEKFDAIANDAVKLSVQSQKNAGLDVFSDGEQRRDNYASFVGTRLEGCQLIPLTDLLPLVDDPEKFQKEMQSLDVPAEKVRHPAVFSKLARRGSIICDELNFLRSILPGQRLKVALPGPYLLSRLMWMDCITDKSYSTREELSQDIVSILREEIFELIDAGVCLVQLDEPVLSEVVFSGPKNARSFMCGALSERGDAGYELSFAGELINAVCEGFPREKLAMHVCRGNWTPDENMALSGGYEALLPLFNKLNIGRLILEFCTPRAGDLHVLENLRSDISVGLGVLNPKTSEVETVDSIVDRARECISILGVERVTLNPDCGFATFADNPVNSSDIAEAKLASAVKAAEILKKEFLH